MLQKQSNQLHIGMVLDAVFPPDPRVENEAIELINEGHKVFLFCLTYSNQLKEDSIHKIEVKRYTSNLLEYKLSALVYTIPLYSVIMKKKIGHFIEENKIDILHVHDMRIAEATFMANKKYQLPIVLDLHENRPEIMKAYPHLKKFPGNVLISLKKWKKKEEEFVKKVSKVIVVTEDAKTELLTRVSMNPNKIISVPNTVRKSFYKDAVIKNDIVTRYKDKFTLLYIGDTSLRRGLLTAIKSLCKLKNKISNIQLVIVGKSNLDDAFLKETVLKYELQDYVDFQGWQQPSLFPSYIFASDICISPLHKNVHHDTTYANKLFQYMSFAKPLLVSNATAQEKLTSRINIGLVHKEKETIDFSEKVLKLYNNKNLREKLGENGKLFIENQFSWEKTSKDLVHLYRNLTLND